MPASVLAQVPAADGRPVHNIKLTDAREVADAKAVNSAITVLFKDAAACPAATSKEREACGCSFKGDLKKLKSAYDAAVAKHPGWNEVDVVVGYRDAANNLSVVTNFPGVKRQLDACSQYPQ
jgi:hypothetical protein